MVALCFAREADWRACCDAAAMRERWGRDRASRLARRLQQLEAMASLDDLTFMPFDSGRHGDGLIEVAVDEETSLFVRALDTAQDYAPVMHPILVVAIGPPTTTVTG